MKFLILWWSIPQVSHLYSENESIIKSFSLHFLNPSPQLIIKTRMILSFPVLSQCWCQSFTGMVSEHHHSKAETCWLRKRRSPVALTTCRLLQGPDISAGQIERRKKNFVLSLFIVDIPLKWVQRIFPFVLPTTAAGLLSLRLGSVVHPNMGLLLLPWVEKFHDPRCPFLCLTTV